MNRHPRMTAAMTSRIRVNALGEFSIPLLDEKGGTPILELGPGKVQHHIYLQAHLPDFETLRKLPIGIASGDAHSVHFEPLYIVTLAPLPAGMTLVVNNLVGKGNVQGSSLRKMEKRSTHWAARPATNMLPSMQIKMGPLEADSWLGVRAVTTYRRSLPTQHTVHPFPYLVLLAKAHFLSGYPDLAPEVTFGSTLSPLGVGGGGVVSPSIPKSNIFDEEGRLRGIEKGFRDDGKKKKA